MQLKPQIKTLKNGLRLLTLDLPQMRSVTTIVMVKVGSRCETEQQAGLSHFLEHMVFKGTQKYPTAFDLTSTVDAIGAEFNAFTSKEYTGFYVKSASEHLDLSLDVLSQLVFQPLLPAAQMEKEKGVIIEEINMYKDNPMAKVAIDFETLMYGLTQLGKPTIGNKKSILKMKKKDFSDYLAQYYQPQNMILGIVGGIKTFNHHILSSWKKGGRQQNKAELKDLNFMQNQPAVKLASKKTEQTHFSLGTRTFAKGHKDRYVLAVLATILGGNMSSRLFMEVREKRGLAYYIKTGTTSYFDNGYLVVQAGTDVRKAPEAIKVILNEFSAISRQPSAIEIKRAKDYLKGKLALGLEDSKGIASLFVEDLLLEGRMRLPREIVKEVEKVSLADIKRVAQTIFVPQGLNLTIIGPYENEGKFEKILKI